ncbi:MAG TPA: hypothetical protein VEM57_03230, partial [Candidatus Binatus sp.]|nr:hypothetical protein [Candidatus Binatus sp.]
AEQHVARCSDCWAVLSILHQLAMRDRSAGADRMGALFGCGAVQEEMYLLADSTAEEIGRRHPDVARHLSSCHACRGRFGEILLVERAAARGELGLPLVAREGPRWREPHAAAGQMVREAVGKLVVQLRRAGAAFTAVPDGFLASPLAVPAGALRGSADERERPDELRLFQRVRFTLAESDLFVELTLQPESRERVGMVVHISGTGRPRLAFNLREIQPDGGSLLARHTMVGGGRVLMRGLVPGQYLLEVEEKQESRRHQVRFEIEATA